VAFWAKRAGYPRFKTRKKSRLSAEYTRSAFMFRDGSLKPAKMSEPLDVDRFYPSSKTCSACGHQIPALPLDVRKWTCAECGAMHDRDVNAARNLQAAGLAVIACGVGVRPQRKPPGGHSALKRETQPATVGTPFR